MAAVADPTLFSLVHDFFKVYLPKQRACSPHTIRAYQTALNSLFDFVKAEKKVALYNITFEMLDNGMISRFLDDLEKNGCGITTRNHRLNCIRAFYSYAAKMNPAAVIHQSEIRKVPLKKPVDPDIVTFMSESAVKTLLEQPDTKTKKGLRDRFFMLLMYDTAARVQEILSVRLCDIRRGKTPVVILHGKGSKVRTVPLMQQTVNHFDTYRKVFHAEESDHSDQFLFYVVQRGRSYPMSDSNARKMMAAYGKTASKLCPEVPEKVHPHLLRHSRAMHLYRHGMDLTLVSQWLGHAQLDTTLIYAYADTEHKRKAIEKATSSGSPLKKRLNAERFTVSDDDMLKRLYGLT